MLRYVTEPAPPDVTGHRFVSPRRHPRVSIARRATPHAATSSRSLPRSSEKVRAREEARAASDRGSVTSDPRVTGRRRPAGALTSPEAGRRDPPPLQFGLTAGRCKGWRRLQMRSPASLGFTRPDAHEPLRGWHGASAVFIEI